MHVVPDLESVTLKYSGGGGGGWGGGSRRGGWGLAKVKVSGGGGSQITCTHTKKKSGARGLHTIY